MHVISQTSYLATVSTANLHGQDGSVHFDRPASAMARVPFQTPMTNSGWFVRPRHTLNNAWAAELVSKPRVKGSSSGGAKAL